MDQDSLNWVSFITMTSRAQIHSHYEVYLKAYSSPLFHNETGYLHSDKGPAIAGFD
jgi:hypothetical protein